MLSCCKKTLRVNLNEMLLKFVSNGAIDYKSTFLKWLWGEQGQAILSTNDCYLNKLHMNHNELKTVSHGTWPYIGKMLFSNSLYKAHQIQKLEYFSSHLAVVFSQPIEVRCQVENDDVVGAARPDDAPITPEWSTSFAY